MREGREGEGGRERERERERGGGGGVNITYYSLFVLLLCKQNQCCSSW